MQPDIDEIHLNDRRLSMLGELGMFARKRASRRLPTRDNTD
jgi:hypothetical protein